ncbi:histidine kinase [Amycolatopsis sp. H20-H5]|nr:histidine kinase [Amycolatopsis sp. H20-H5]MEC3981542.1 histidine kinase [Amycolatopsis sp. H20-H5]
MTEYARLLGLPGVVLVAALLVDLGIILPASADDSGPKGVDLFLLPGILAMAGCVWWARSRAAVAAFAGAATLVVFSVFINFAHAPAYSTVLARLSATEVVAGFELVYYVVRRARPGVAFAAVCSLVVAALIAITNRGQPGVSGGVMIQSLLFGVVLLGGSVLLGARGGRPAPKPRVSSPLIDLARTQWLLIGVLAFALLYEFAEAFKAPRALPIVLCSLGAALLSVLASRYPVPSALGLTALLFLSAMVTPALNLRYSYPLAVGVPATQVVATLATVIHLVRSVPGKRAWSCIGGFSAVVALAVIVNAERPGPRPLLDLAQLKYYAAIALLLLGIAVVIGLFLRSRDSERKQVVLSAVTDAQTSERMALARELHDVVAHHVTGIVVQAQAARLLGEKNPLIALEAMGRIEDAGVEALAAMRRLVRSMRGDAAAGSSEFSEQATTDLEADLRKLVDGSNHGVPTMVGLNLPEHLPQEVGRSALRLVQESLTNVGKHAAGAEHAFVLAEVIGRELHLRVTDDGKEADHHPVGGSGGYGLIGMRERVALLHGRLEAGRGRDGGWRVEVWLPLEGEE